MRNRDLFLKDPTTSKLLNNGVTKVIDAQTEEELKTLRFELESFVCDGEYARGLHRILISYLENFDDPEQSAVWVSGFYGSGKSHLVKVLRYLWVDYQFLDDKASARGITNLPEDIQAALVELSSLGKRSGGLHAACGTLGGWGGPSIRLGLMSIIFNSVGLPEDFAQARFVLWLKSNKIYDKLREFVEAKGKKFEQELAHLYVSPHISEGLVDIDPDFASSASEARLLLKAQFPREKDISNAQMVEIIRETLSVDGRMPCTLIVLDELQQYIGGDADRSYRVQEMIEACAKGLGGHLLIVGTGQAALVGTPQLEKLKGRFKITIQLSDTDVEKVTREVVLAKRQDKVKQLKDTLEKHSGEISRQLSSSKIGPRSEDDDIIIADYPLLPVRRRFWERCLRAVDRAGTAGQLRTQLRIVHEGVKQYADESIGSVIPADLLYDQINVDLIQTGELLREVDKLIKDQKDGTPDGELRSRLCALIFLIGKLPSKDNPAAYVGVSATAETLADLLVTDLKEGSGALRQRIPELLEKLVEDGHIIQIDDEYRIQTQESRAWEQAFQNARSKIANDLQRLSSERGEQLRLAVSHLLGSIKLVHGRSKVPRNVDTYFNADMPEPSGQSIPVWVRDEWSVALGSIQADAREAGTDSSIIHVFLPKKSADEFKDAISGWKAAQEILDIKGVPATDEGREARQGMETRAISEKKRTEQIIREVMRGARVFMGGGDEVTAIELKSAVEEAAESALARLYPEFDVADHPGWDTVVKRARKVDSNALQAVDYEGDTDKHPVCAEILRSLNSWKKGRDIRSQFKSPPYGWSQDAVSGALLALLVTGHVVARLQGNPQQAKELDQSRIGIAEFRAETTVLTASQRLAIRKLLQSASIDVKSGEELASIPGFIRYVRELADSAGGEKPLPEPPNAAYLKEIESLSGNDQLMQLYDQRDRIKEDLEKWQHTQEKIVKRKPEWDNLVAMMEHAAALPISQEVESQVEAIRSNRSLLDDPNPLSDLCAKLVKALRDEVNKRYRTYTVAYDTYLKSLESSDDWCKLDADKQAQILNEEGLKRLEEPKVGTDKELIASLSRISLADWLTRTDALEARFKNVRLKVAKMFEPKTISFKLPATTVKCEEDIDKWLAEVKKEILKKLDDPDTWAVILGG